MDIITIEFEKINVAALEVLESHGKLVSPSAKIISTIQDKGVQKQFYCDNEIPTSKFVTIQNKEELFSLLENGTIEFPFVQKTRKDGYDGYGVKICKSEDTEFFDAPSIIEELVDIKKEVAIIICRSKSGEIAIYEPVEMIFNSEANLLDYQISPALLIFYLFEDVLNECFT